MKQREEWEQMFNAIDDEGRRYVMAVLRGEFERTRKLPHARLRLVAGGKVAPGLTEGQINPLPVSSTS